MNNKKIKKNPTFSIDWPISSILMIHAMPTLRPPLLKSEDGPILQLV